MIGWLSVRGIAKFLIMRVRLVIRYNDNKKRHSVGKSRILNSFMPKVLPIYLWPCLGRNAVKDEPRGMSTACQILYSVQKVREYPGARRGVPFLIRVNKYVNNGKQR